MKKIDSGFKTAATLLVISALMLTGCGSSFDSAKSQASGSTVNYASEAAYDSADYGYFDDAYSAEYDTEEKARGGSDGGLEVNDTSRKLIKNVNLSVETEDYDTLVNNVTGRVNALGGYIEDSYSYNGSSYREYGRELKYGNLTIRIPAENLDEFLNNIAEISNITSKNYNVSDVTLQYVDVEARKESLNTQHKRLLELMEQAETVEDIIALEERLSDIEYELDSAERQLRSYDNQVDYSTVYMDISEVERFTPTAPKTRLQEMGEGFVNSIYDAIDNILDFFVGLVVALPHIIVFLLIVLIIFLIVRAIIRKSKKKRAAKQQMYYAAVGNENAAVNTTTSTDTVNGSEGN